MMRSLIAIVVAFLFAQTAAADDSAPRANRRAFARADHITFPEAAPYSPQVATLGKMLFFDPRMSGAQNMSCATCHNPSFGWETPVPHAIGALNVPLARHTPALENLAGAPHLFWDGRAGSLEEQAKSPITNPKEMNAPIPQVIARISAIRGYRVWFDLLFPREGLTEKTLLRSIATYERTLQSGWAPFDDWVEGVENAISEPAKRGFDLFVGKARCASCHSGWAFTDFSFHDVGLDTDDLGRWAVAPGDPMMRYAFKVPSLRNIQLKAPYSHNGSMARLDDVIAHYIAGGIDRPSKSPLIAPMDLSDGERSDLIAFLNSLTAYDAYVAAPSLPAE